MLEIYLIRHGVTSWNLEKRFQGASDIPLSPEGIEQAKKVSLRLKDLKFDAIYSSDLKRAYQTAEIIAEPHNLEVNPCKEFREIDIGVWAGLTIDEIARDYPEQLKIWREKPTQALIPGCEGLVSVAQRSFNRFSQLVKKHSSDERIVIISHGMVITALLSKITGICLDNPCYRGQGNTAINIIRYDGENFKLILSNCIKHCEE